MFKFFLIIFCLAFTQCSDSDKNPKYLVHLHHLGDANAIIPVLDQIKDSDYKIILTGTAAQKYKDHKNIIALPGDLEKMSPTDLFSDSQIKIILKHTPTKLFLSGIASRSQAQLNNILRNNSVKTATYYDNFDPPFPKGSQESYITPYLEEYSESIASPTILLLPTPALKQVFHKIKKFSNCPIEIVGQPTLTSWDMFYDQFNEEKQRLLKKELNLTPDKRIIVFAGGYDPVFKDIYKKQLETFLKVAAEIKGVKVLVTYHPKTSGDIEKDAILKYGNNNAIIIEKGTYSTQELTTIADIVATYKSSIGAQALYKGKNVLYIAEPAYENTFVENNLATHASTFDRMMNSLLPTISMNSKSFDTFFIKNPTTIFKDWLVQIN